MRPMGVLPDWEIKRLCREEGMLEPYFEGKEGSPSYGFSPFGYDVRLGNRFLYLDTEAGAVYLDPKKPDPIYKGLEAGSEGVFLFPGMFVLAETVEKFKMPPDVVGLVKDKSSYARRGIAVQNTVIEPGWRGVLTLELSNHGKSMVKLVPGLGIAQIMFMRGEIPHSSYSGKYQDQVGVTEAK